MSTPPEELVDLIARADFEHNEPGADWVEAQDIRDRNEWRANARAILAAIAEYVPSGHLLDPETWEVVEVKHVADFDWDLDQDTGLAEPFACNWSHDADLIGSLNAGQPLVALSPREQAE